MTGYEIIEALREARYVKGISLRALAARSGYDTTGLCQWERHRRTMSLRAACDLAQALGMEIILRDRGRDE